MPSWRKHSEEGLAAHRDRTLPARLLLHRTLGQFTRVSRSIRRGQLTIGPHTYGKPLVVAYPNEPPVRIGAYCSIASDVTIFAGGNHRVDWVSTFPFRAVLGLPGAFSDGHPASKGSVTVGNDVWLGYGATVMSGIEVGDGAVIAAKAVVTQDVAPYSVVAGCPAREIRRRFSPVQISALLEIAWWEWSDSAVQRAIPDLCSADIDGFIDKYGAPAPTAATRRALAPPGSSDDSG